MKTEDFLLNDFKGFAFSYNGFPGGINAIVAIKIDKCIFHYYSFFEATASVKFTIKC